MAHKRKRSFRRRRGGKRRKMTAGKVKRIVKKELRKNVEMKHVSQTVAKNLITGGTELRTVIMPSQGVDVINRIGDSINLWRWNMNLSIFGYEAAGAAPARVRIMVMWSHISVPVTSLPSTINGLPQFDLLKESGTFIMSDRTYVVAPNAVSTNLAADVYAWFPASHPSIRNFKFRFRLKGRKNTVETDGSTPRNGFLQYYFICDTFGGDEVSWQSDSRVYYTDP